MNKRLTMHLRSRFADLGFGLKRANWDDSKADSDNVVHDVLDALERLVIANEQLQADLDKEREKRIALYPKIRSKFRI